MMRNIGLMIGRYFNADTLDELQELYPDIKPLCRNGKLVGYKSKKEGLTFYIMRNCIVRLKWDEDFYPTERKSASQEPA